MLIFGHHFVLALRLTKTAMISITVTVKKRASKTDWNSQDSPGFDSNNNVRTSAEQGPVKTIQPIDYFDVKGVREGDTH